LDPSKVNNCPVFREQNVIIDEAIGGVMFNLGILFKLNRFEFYFLHSLLRGSKDQSDNQGS